MKLGLTISKHRELIQVIRKIMRRHFWYVITLLIINAAAIAFIISGFRFGADTTEAVALISSSHGAGSGFLINEDGLMLTAAHVIKGDQEVGVQFRNGFYTEAKVLIYDEKHDIGLLKLNDITDLPGPLELGDSDLVKEAEEVYVIGYPDGEYAITEGIISQKTENYIKTDAAVNPGNSGGPLITKDNKLAIGIIVSTKVIAGEKAEGAHYAVPINVVETVCKDKGYSIRE